MIFFFLDWQHRRWLDAHRRGWKPGSCSVHKTMSHSMGCWSHGRLLEGLWSSVHIGRPRKLGSTGSNDSNSSNSSDMGSSMKQPCTKELRLSIFTSGLLPELLLTLVLLTLALLTLLTLLLRSPFQETPRGVLYSWFQSQSSWHIKINHHRRVYAGMNVGKSSKSV